MKQTAAPLSSKLFHEIRRRIIVGTYEQGERLPEQRLAEDLKVSRIPLREAIPQLEVEGFVRTNPRRGVVVRQWTERTVHDLFDARLAIEPRAARLAATQVTRGTPATDLNERLAVSETELHKGGDPLQMSTANAAFHQALVAAAGNELLSSLMNAVAGRMVWLFYLTKQRDPVVACAEHQAITEAVNAGNPELTEALVFAHIEAGRVPSLESMAALLADEPGADAAK